MVMEERRLTWAEIPSTMEPFMKAFRALALLLAKVATAPRPLLLPFHEVVVVVPQVWIWNIC